MCAEGLSPFSACLVAAGMHVGMRDGCVAPISPRPAWVDSGSPEGAGRSPPPLGSLLPWPSAPSLALWEIQGLEEVGHGRGQHPGCPSLQEVSA